MREILFKAKRIDNGEWVEGSYLYCEKATTVSFRNEHYMLVFDGYGVAYHEIDKNTICQFTGLYDGTKWEDLTEKEKQTFYEDVCSEDGKSIKYQNAEDVKHLWKGKKIWENDVVRDVDEDMIVVVRWDEEKLMFVFDYYNSNGFIMETFGFDDFCSPINESLEVIGTKFDNPELMNTTETIGQADNGGLMPAT